MLDRLRRIPPRTLRLAILGALVLVLIAMLGAHSLASFAAATEIRRAAAARGLAASWRSLEMSGAFEARLRGLTLRRGAHGDTLFRAELFAVALDPWSLLRLAPRPARLTLEHARAVVPGGGGGAAPDTVAEPDPARPRAAAERVRRAAATIARVALAPARALPEIHLRDFEAESRGSDEVPDQTLALASLDLTHPRGGARLAASGSLGLEQTVPFEVGIDYGRDDRLAGTVWFGVPDTVRGVTDTLTVRFDGTLVQDRRRGLVRLAEGTRVWIGSVPLRLGGTLERRGPRIIFSLAADSLTERRIERSVPAPLLGPLTGLAVEGWFDYRLALDLDIARPDSVAFRVDVVPHGLGLNADGTTLPILGLDEPFVASIHLPHDRLVVRELSPANPFYRPLEGIDSTLVHAVVTNEDGGFFHHRGFNLDAVRGSIAENLRAGAYRRGAGTITMQLARNLYLGHRRTLSRKAQEVVLAWVLEHLTGVTKARLLEIYLNIIEWGPGVHGAAEAARYYFDADPAHLTPAQSLFLSTLLPAPTKWRWKFDRAGVLRVSTRQQMRFIARAMSAKGWFDPGALPTIDSLDVAITGPARDELLGDAARAAVTHEGAPTP
jgi:hypothetical protein